MVRPAPVIRIGLAGLGIHGARYARHLLAGDVPGARLVAVSRRDADLGTAFAREHGVGFEADPRDLAGRDDVDAVIAVLRPDLHGTVAGACLDRDVPVLVEKPLAASVAEADALAAADPDGRRVLAGHTLRFDALVERMRACVAELGRIDLVGVDQHFEPATRPWLDHRGPGGVLLNTAVHGLDLLRHLTGLDPTAVSAETGVRTTRRTADVAAITVRLGGDGVLGSVRNARTGAGRAGRIEVVGERGHLVGDFVHRTLVRIEGRRGIELGPVPDTPTIPAVLAAFVRAVRDGGTMPVSARDGALAVRMAVAAQESADSGVRVRLAPDDVCYRNETSP